MKHHKTVFFGLAGLLLAGATMLSIFHKRRETYEVQ